MNGVPTGMRSPLGSTNQVFLRQRLIQAEALLNKMLAIHSLAFDAEVTAESYPGEKHEEAEEAWCREVAAFLVAL